MYPHTIVVAGIAEEVGHGPEIGMKSEAVVAVIKETENLVRRERVEKAIGIAKKLRKHKHLHHNNTHVLILYKNSYVIF